MLPAEKVTKSPTALRQVAHKVSTESKVSDPTSGAGTAPGPGRRRAEGLWPKTVQTCASIAPFAKPHKRLFFLGALAAVGVVGARLALPWPLRAITDGLTQTTGAVEVNVLMPGLAFLALMALLGLSDFLERLSFARFSIATMRSLRKTAFSRALGLEADNRKSAAGDMVSRLIGDVARVKAGLQGFLVHVATNGLLFLGVTAILFSMNVKLGLIFAAAGLVTIALTVWGARRIFANALRHREREGQLANRIHLSLKKGAKRKSLHKINKASSRYEATQTRLQGQMTWAAHCIFGVAVLGALLASAAAVQGGTLAVGDMIVFMMYALLMSGPMVRLTRQGTRTGKILGPAYRLVQLLDAPPAGSGNRPGVRLRTLKKSLRLEKVVIRRPGGGRFDPIDLSVNAHERVCMVVDDNAALRPLLEVMAGLRKPLSGKVHWDALSLKARHCELLATQVRLVRMAPVSVSGATLRELRMAQLAANFHYRASVWLFADLGEGLSAEDSARLMSVFKRPAGAEKSPAVLVLTDRPADATTFDRVLQIRDGGIVFDGPAASWAELAEG